MVIENYEKKEKPIFKAVIFDLDGVLIDSEQVSINCFLETFNKFNIIVSRKDFLSRYIGMSTKNIIDDINKRLKISIDIDEFLLSKQKIYNKELKQKAKVFVGVKELFDNLFDNNIKIAVASSGNREKVKANFKFISGFFDIEKYVSVLISGDDVENSKPDPFIYNLAAKKLCVENSSCVVVEDAVLGVVASIRAGMKSIIVTNTFSDGEIKDMCKKKDCKVDMIVESLENISYKIINKFLFNY